MQVTDEMVRVAAQAYTDECLGHEQAYPVAIKAALTAALAAIWRDMKDAPRDGTGILVKLPDSDMPHTAKFWRGSWTMAWDHSELKGWDTPTHWMPLPSAPSQLSKRDDAERDSTHEA